jgi:hypothetical protein
LQALALYTPFVTLTCELLISTAMTGPQPEIPSAEKVEALTWMIQGLERFPFNFKACTPVFGVSD